MYLSETWKSRGEINNYGKEKDNVGEEKGARWENEGWNPQQAVSAAPAQDIYTY